MTGWNRSTWIVLGVVWSLSAVYVGTRLTRGWVPHDEGTLAQSAERVLGGELPHGDFDDPYTGGLSFLNAAGFRELGTNLLTPRVLLFLVVLAWVPAVYAIARRFVPPLGAGAATTLSVIWSVPNYPAAMPSWYNLFLATFGVLAVLRYFETERSRWLVVAGICGGLSVLFKIIGLYYVAGVLLALVYRHVDATPPDRTTRVVISGALLAFVLLLVLTVWQRLGSRELVHFVLPGAALCGLIGWRMWRNPVGAAGVRDLWRVTAPFVAGVAVPVVVYLLPYLARGSVRQLLVGVFVAPQHRFTQAALNLPPLWTLEWALPLAAALGFVIAGRRALPRATPWVCAGILLIVLGFSASTPVYRDVWHSLRGMVPLTVAAGVFLLGRNDAQRTTHDPRLFLLLAVTAECSLVQYPFSAPIYFLYVLPLAFLAALAVLTSGAQRLGSVLAIAAAFYGVFGVLRVNPGFIYNMGLHYERVALDQPLALPRGGLRVTRADQQLYQALVDTVQAHAGSSRYLYATPDCPEVYFLAGRLNPTRSQFEFLGGDQVADTAILGSLARHAVRVIVINGTPEFSAGLQPALAAELSRRFPAQRQIGRFTVRWLE